MNKYHYTYVLIISVLLLFCIIVIARSNKINVKMDEINDKINAFEHYFKLIEFRERETIINNNVKIASDLIIMDKDKNYINFANMFTENTDSPKLVIRYSALACDICLETELKLIKDYIHCIGPENIILLASNYNIRGIKILTKTIPFDFKIYQVEKIGVPFEINNNNLYSFIIDKELTLKDFFIPEKTLPDLSRNYYEVLCEKYYR